MSCARCPGRTRPTADRRGPRAARRSRGWPRPPGRRSRPRRSCLADQPRGLVVAEGQLGETRAALLRLAPGIEDQLVLRRLAAHRIGGGGVAGEHEGLAAAAAEVLGLLVAAATGLGHPVVAAEAVEAEGVVPDVADVVLAH